MRPELPTAACVRRKRRPPPWTTLHRLQPARSPLKCRGKLFKQAEPLLFPRAHWPQIYSTNPLERLNAEIKRRTNVVGIFPNDASITRLVGAMMLEQNDEWSLNRRYMQLEGLQTLCDTVPTRLPAVAR